MKIVIADDHAVVRTGFSMLINYQKDMEVIGTAADGRQAFDKVKALEPDVLLMDLSMPPGESGLFAASRINDAFPEVKILILTMYDDEEYIVHTFKSGAKGYILKNSPDDELIRAIRKVHGGDRYVDPVLMDENIERLLNNEVMPEQLGEPFSVLTRRELEILPLIAKGYGNKDIAEMLFVSVKTVEAHKSRIMEKLELSNRPELVEYAMKKKLIDF
ncbi:response regulator transcription factor [Salinicoccus sp. ID82-1]|uniref:Response regulator transcription factor n=1 Tax=Salinicoccus cyprini TaxID=2493691 RepID=A0A558AR53_9STAP|nr:MULTISPECIES: response regulator transcription factor [Salinicoccus]MCG1010225.1 response regulator transcription factor [Salinicoccus sp. ID82-1]TVT26722.1 response regulator transcription factor [Salinicoccus cyprini]